MAQEHEPQNGHRAHLEGLLDRLREVAQSLLRGGPEAALRPGIERRTAAHGGRIDVSRMLLLKALEEVQGDRGRERDHRGYQKEPRPRETELSPQEPEEIEAERGEGR